MPTGVYISEILSGSGADKAGLPKGSIITKLDGITIDSMATLQEQSSMLPNIPTAPSKAT